MREMEEKYNVELKSLEGSTKGIILHPYTHPINPLKLED